MSVAAPGAGHAALRQGRAAKAQTLLEESEEPDITTVRADVPESAEQTDDEHVRPAGCPCCLKATAQSDCKRHGLTPPHVP
jgi:hypothetical protein